MVTRLSRSECFRTHPLLAQAVRGLQDAYDPARRGEDAVDEDEAAWFATFRDAPDDFPPADALPHAGSLILLLPADDADALAEALPGALARLLVALGADGLAFVHPGRMAPWTTRRRSPPVLAESARRFRALGAGKGFHGALRVDAGSLAEVVAPLFWHVRLDGSYSQWVFFAPARGPFVGSLCQYGNLHLDVYGTKGDLAAVLAAARDAGFQEPPEDDYNCSERFGPGGRIEGRAIRV